MDSKILSFILGLTAILQSEYTLSQGEYSVRNLSYLYDDNQELRFQNQCFFEKDQINVIGEIQINETRTQISDLFIQHGFMNDYDDEMIFSPDTLKMDDIWIGNRGTRHYLRFSVINPEEYQYLVIKIFNRLTNTDFIYDIPIPQDDSSYNPQIMVRDSKTGFDNMLPYIKQSQQYTFSTIDQSADNISGFSYFESFNVARPPMAPPDDAVSKDITIDSAFTISKRDTLKFSREGLYFFQSDTSKLIGTARRIVNPYFPKIVRMDQLVEVMTYITSGNEKSKILNASDQKKEFDAFWLDNTKSSNRAANSIRLFFRRVRKANEIFTTYKEGWKTDKGMIYIIYGPPDEVYRYKNNQEEWRYSRTAQLPAISFNFYRIKSIFSSEHYVLLRKKSYQTIWFQAVDNWRKGQIEQ